MTQDEARAQFRILLQRLDADIEIDRAALLLAAAEYPRLSVEFYLERLDEITAEARTHMTPAQLAAPAECAKALATHLFSEGQFNGNNAAYYDVRNSFLNEVIERGKGIPITLAIIFIAVARRFGVRLFGVGMPGHFIVKYCDEADEIYFDPFHGGRVLDEEKCRAMIAEMYNGQVQFDPVFLHAFTNKQILWRMLQNLKGIYFKASDMSKAVGVLDRLLLINPVAAEEIRDRGLAYFALKKYAPARTDLQYYLTLAPAAADKEKIKEILQDLRLRQATLN